MPTMPASRARIPADRLSINAWIVDALRGVVVVGGRLSRLNENTEA